MKNGLRDINKKNKKSVFLFGFVFDLNKNLTLKKDKLFSFSLLNRFFALSLQRVFHLESKVKVLL